MELISNCKIVYNDPRNNSDTGEHVKPIVVETGFAGAVLLERKNSVTSQWFVPTEDYLPFIDFKEGSNQLNWAKGNDDELRKMAQRFREKVLKYHSPKAFWEDVFAQAGVA
jgi:hypothetical protein